MKKNLPVTDRENDYSSDLKIVSTTDLKGAITHVNEDFCTIAGFSKEELLNKNHNIIRHPDMPPAAFQNLWDTVKLGKPWMGIVKNRCKNGDYYWVNAYVTPLYEDGHVTGYQSVRLKPQKEHVERAETLYKTLWKPPSAFKKLITFARSSSNLKLFSAIALTNVLSCLVLWLFNHGNEITWWPYFVAVLLIGLPITFLCTQSLRTASEWSKNIFNNTVAAEVYSGKIDEVGQITSVIEMQKAQQQTIVYRINDAASGLKTVADSALNATRKTQSSMEAQKEEIEQVATAMNQMTATIQEVARNTSATAEATNKAEAEAKEGQTIVNLTMEDINSLAKEVGNATVVIGELEKITEKIDGAVEEIQGIAEQTNLLALNAAIEAARAGEQGRGFAVVADEVRALAARVQSSTNEIHSMIDTLSSTTNNATEVMQKGQDSAERSVKRATEAKQALHSITEAVNHIMAMSTQIATATEQQHTVCEEINQRVTNINDVTDATLEATVKNTQMNQQLDDEVTKLGDVVRQFGFK
ncbi:methyl-accepting chemotaxis protein [Pleionea sediminis]|uniref:methyl-accepting chemotaxis protein n=1 Tax=Pleionea sediminis TaxID=2569479 RepID=UPI001186D306|nr:PAS domain-containing methyl-accepting chemotaxis protein [Pleionea sediminis]